MKIKNTLILFAIVSLLLLSCDKPEFTNLADTDLTFPAPTNLTVTQTSPTSCNLSWQDNSTGEQGFKIDRKKDSEEWIIAYQTVNENVETLGETDLTAYSTYQYRVYGFADENTSAPITGTIELLYIAIDIDGNVYQIVQIGDQEWMSENLKVTHYRNGDAIPHLTNSGDWTSTNSSAYCVYNNTPSNADTYGNLYNWYAVNDSRGLAPEGWHIPTDEEIMVLEMYLGMSESEANDTGWRGTNEGSKLAGSADLWTNGDLVNNAEFGSSGFSFLPGGYRYYSDGTFYYMSDSGFLWSSTEYYSNYAWFRLLRCNSTTVYRHDGGKRFGFSVRCVRD